jgi:cobalt-zinc-cadmium efflux system outer membrane protein
MKKKIFLLFMTCGLHPLVHAQSMLDSVLGAIASNNMSTQANTLYWEAKKLEFKSGLTPKDPTVEYDYLNGSPAGAGNQTDFLVTQSFDFPTAYGKKTQLANEQIKQAEFQLLSSKQEILLEAKLICIELVYRNKLQIELTKRKASTEKWLADFQRKLNKGEGNILDVNKAKLQRIEIVAHFQENASAINQLHQKLTELNGGIEIVFADTEYSDLPTLPSFGVLETEIEVNDPIRKYLEQQKIISQKQVELSKAMSLPKLETGYHYQTILGQTFNGVHIGFSIPLWENKNMVEADLANHTFNNLNLEDHKNEHFFEIQQKYEKQIQLGKTLIEYEMLFANINTVQLLDKSLALGHISTVEYFLEMTYYFEALKNYLQIEMEYHQIIAELYKHKL